MRRSLVCLLAVSLLTCRTSRPPAGAAPAVSVEPIPARAYKIADPGHEKTESWLLNLRVRDEHGQTVTLAAVRIDLLSGETVVKRIELDRRAVEAITYAATKPSPASVLRLRFSEPAAFAVDKVHCRVEIGLSSGERVTRTVEVPVSLYRQKTELIFPFRGPGIVMQAGFNDGGHRNRSGLFAIDTLGLTANYAPQLKDEDRNESYAGWGREILAPGDGVVVFARNDVPENTILNVDPDPSVYTMPDGQVVDTGNSVVIDHGNGEFSLVAHMQRGSVRVRVGERVTRGQVIGLLGNSGNATGPHVHYQLQSGPDPATADGLPVEFSNLKGRQMFRATWFDAK